MLSPAETEELALLENLERRRKARQSLLAFAEYTHPQWITARHHRAIAEKLEAVERGEIRRLIIEMPPRHGKTECASRRFPAWYLGRNPTREIMSVAYNADLAIDEYGRKVRNIVRDPLFASVFPDVTLAEDSSAAGRWNTNHGGGYVAGGIVSGITGRGAHILLVDDPVKGRADAESETVRRKLWDWYDSDAKTRLAPGGAIILIGTRWHELDLTGLVLKHHASEGWVRVRMPAIANEHTDHEEALWPDRFPLEHLRSLRESYAKSHPRHWTSLYQQDPQPERGDYIQREWFAERYGGATPTEGTGKDARPTPLNVYMASDFAVAKPREGREPDFTELGIFGIAPDSRIYVLDWWSGQTTSDVWVEKSVDLMLKWKPIACFGEGGVIRHAVEPFLRRRMLERKAYTQLEWLNPIHDKATHGRAFQARAAMGCVVFGNQPWVERLIAQCVGFPGAAFDDVFDTMGKMCRAIDEAHPATKRPDNSKPPEDRWDKAFARGRGSGEGYKTA